MTGLHDWTSDQVRRIYSEALFFALECPTTLFLCILRVNRLRVKAAKTEWGPEKLALEGSSILGEIYRFDADNWVEPYDIPLEPYYTHVAQIFKASVSLYALCSLPRSTVAAFLNRGSSFDHASHLESLMRKHLIDRINSFLQVSTTLSTLPWPLAVLGFSASSGTASERAAVERILHRLCVSELIGPQGSTVLLKQLKEFWSSGRKEWDECFNEPIVVLDT